MTSNITAQHSIQRSLIGSSGSMMVSNSHKVLRSAIGQSSLVSALQAGSKLLTQGFIQPQINNDSQTKKIVAINMYPNPTKANFTITWKKPSQALAIKAFNMDGRLVHSQTLSSAESFSFNFQHLPNGLYHISLEDNGAVVAVGKLALL